MRRVVIIGAGARGNRVFADLIANHPTGFSLAGVVEINEAKRRAFQRQYGIPDRFAFGSTDAFLDVPCFADIVFICTPDPTHFPVARAVSRKGYDVLLEKPIATNLPDCLALLDVQETYGNQIIVAHVLRYSPFFRTIKEIMESGRLGSIRHVRLVENVAHWHFAHSYVRGNWRRTDTSAPIILTKSCHDLDVLQWLVGEQVTAVSSHGGLTYFTPEHAPEGAADRCVHCPHRDDCIYSATRFYLNDADEWPYNVISPLSNSVADRANAITEGPYGRCVYLNDNDVCDNQVVTLEFRSGVVANFGLHSHTWDNTRRITILFDNAELEGDLHRNEITVSHFTGKPNEVRQERIAPGGRLDNRDYHGGGDVQLLYALNEHLTTGGHREIMSSLSSSLASHALAFLAERSRRNKSVRIPVPEIFAPDGPDPALRKRTSPPAA